MKRTVGISHPLGAGESLAKLRVLSTHLFMNERLRSGLLEIAVQSGAQAVEIFAARQHFDYTSREHVADLAAWFRSNPLEAWSMHAPLHADREMGRSGAPALSLLHPEKTRRIAALEHLGAFARPLGVRPLVENLTGDPTTPEHLMEILKIGHFDSTGVCLDLGHAHITVGVQQAIATFADRIVQVHVHDNHGQKDEHLWPGDGRIDWPATAAAINALPAPPAIVLEISSKLPDEPAALSERIRKAFELMD